MSSTSGKVEGSGDGVDRPEREIAWHRGSEVDGGVWSGRKRVTQTVVWLDAGLREGSQGPASGETKNLNVWLSLHVCVRDRDCSVRLYGHMDHELCVYHVCVMFSMLQLKMSCNVTVENAL